MKVDSVRSLLDFQAMEKRLSFRKLYQKFLSLYVPLDCVLCLINFVRGDPLPYQFSYDAQNKPTVASYPGHYQLCNVAR